MKSKLRAYLELVRPPNLFTAAGDSVGGFFFAGGLFGEWSVALRLGLASMVLYAGGVALNDVCDAPRDALERPSRPIPSGRVSREAAFRLAIALLAIGIGLAATVSVRAGAIAAGAVAAIVMYDAVLKRTPLAAPMMGGCRALNLAMGMFALPGLSLHRAARPLGLMGVYVASVTLMARGEASGGGRWRVAMGTAGVVAATFGLSSLRWSGYDARHGEFAWLAVGLCVAAAAVGVRAAVRPVPAFVQSAVKWNVLMLIGFDACLAWVTSGPAAGCVVLSLLVPALGLSRTFRVT